MRKIFTSERFELVDATTLKDNGKKVEFSSKSNMMCYLYENGISISDIQRFTNCHYSFVYGVIERKCGIVKGEKKESASDTIRSMSDEGMKVGDIAKQLNKNYSFVFGVVKKHKESMMRLEG